MDKIAVVIVNWNTGSLLAKCVQSLQQLAEAERALMAHVVIVDNASHDKSIAEAKAATDGTVPVTYKDERVNHGFAGANNVAIKELALLGAGTSHVLLLNPDTEMKAGALSAFLTALREHPKVGIVGARLLNPDGSSQESVRLFPTLPVLAFSLLKLNRLLPQVTVWRRYLEYGFDYSKEAVVDQVMGAAFLIRNTLRDEIGLLDDGFFIWFEEVDYCWRAAQAGWQTLYTPRAEVVHHGGVSFNQLVGWKKSLPWLASMRRYTFKNIGPLAGLIVVALTPVALLLALPAAVLHAQLRSENKARL